MPAHTGHDEEVRNLTILYATETGNAQDIAERLSRFCKRLLFQTRVFSVDKFPLVRSNLIHLLLAPGVLYLLS